MRIKGHGRNILGVSCIALLAIVTQMSLHGWIYRNASGFGATPPFLMAPARHSEQCLHHRSTFRCVHALPEPRGVAVADDRDTADVCLVQIEADG
jgi:hypothetical protein